MDIMRIIYIIIAILLIVNGLFWSLGSHKSHCNIAKYMGMKECIPHYIHISSGIILYICGVIIVQREYIFRK